MLMRTRPALLSLLLVLAACSDDKAAVESTAAWPAFDQAEARPAAESTSTTPLPRACDLVSLEQAQAALNQGASLMSDDPEACVFASSDHPGSITMLMVLVSESDDIAMAQQVFSGVTGMPGNLNALINQKMDARTRKSGRELDDLGDEAWWSGSNADLVNAQQLVVRKGRRMLTLNVTGMGASDGLAGRMEALARSTVPRL
jgi:hypothetical protein